MDLFIVVLAIGFLQVWGADNPLHRDQWFYAWKAYLARKWPDDANGQFVFAVGVPALGVAVLFALLALSSSWLVLPFGILLLLYSFGRGEFSEIVTEYTKACYVEDWESALERASRLDVQVDDVPRDDWSALHRHVLDEAAYRGFERMFAVLFWFFVIGPVGALVYRLVFLYVARDGTAATARAGKALWLLEWPAVRVLGLSFALTGNFVGCYNRWRESLLCFNRPSRATLSASVLGALLVDDELSQTCEVTRKELSLLDRLYRRTLWLWLALAALVVIFV